MNKQFYNKQLNKRRKEEDFEIDCWRITKRFNICNKRRKEEDFYIDCWRIAKRFNICNKRRYKRKRSN